MVMVNSSDTNIDCSTESPSLLAAYLSSSPTFSKFTNGWHTGRTFILFPLIHLPEAAFILEDEVVPNFHFKPGMASTLLGSHGQQIGIERMLDVSSIWPRHSALAACEAIVTLLL